MPISFGVFGKKEGDKKRTQTKSYPFISHRSFWRKSTLKKRTVTDELPTVPFSRSHPAIKVQYTYGSYMAVLMQEQTKTYFHARRLKREEGEIIETECPLVRPLGRRYHPIEECQYACPLIYLPCRVVCTGFPTVGVTTLRPPIQ